MRFKLFDKAGNQMVHEGVMPSAPSPAVVIWGARAFIKRGETTEARTAGGAVVASYVEVPAFKIGGFL